jgi:hypothetical protein
MRPNKASALFVARGQNNLIKLSENVVNRFGCHGSQALCQWVLDLHQVFSDDDSALEVFTHTFGPLLVSDGWIVAGDEMT